MSGKQVIYTMGPGGQQVATPLGQGTPLSGAVAAQAVTPGTTNRIVVLKTSSGGMTAISPQALSPAILEALKKQGVNLSNVKVVPPSSMPQQLSLASIVAKPTPAIPAMSMASTSEAETGHPQSEASEAAAALVSSMQEETVPAFTPAATTTGVQIHTIANPTSVATASLLSQGTSLLSQAQVTIIYFVLCDCVCIIDLDDFHVHD
jgi:hypothetical protein